MHFTKMHGLGNDYLYVYGKPVNPEALSIRLSERHFGVGSDGMIWISPSKIADFKMRIFNADGSEAKMCGNGIRTLHLQVVHGKVSGVSVDMGIATAKPELTLEFYDTGAGPKQPPEFLHGIKAVSEHHVQTPLFEQKPGRASFIKSFVTAGENPDWLVNG